MINSGRVELLDDARLFQQLCGLERTVARAGRETVCKGAGNHDDLANSAAGSLCLAALAVKALTFHVPFVDYRPRALSVRDIPNIPLSRGFAEPVQSIEAETAAISRI